MRLHFSLLLLSYAAILPDIAWAACSVFTPNKRSHGDTIYTATLTNHRVSAVVNCSGSELGTQYPNDYFPDSNPTCNSTQCALWIPKWFSIRVHTFLNVSLQSPEAEQDLLELVRDTLDFDNIDFNQTIVRPVANAVGTCLNEGSAGNWNFAPTYYCTEGVLSECEDTNVQNAPQNGWTIRACGLGVLNGLTSSLKGSLNVVDLYGFNSQPAPQNASLEDASGNDENAAVSLISWGGSGVLWSLASALLVIVLQI